MGSWIRLLRPTLRGLHRAPAFTVAASFTLALGIGLSTAVFTVAHAVIVRPLPVGDQDRLVLLWGEARDGSFDEYPLPLAQIRELADRSQTLGDVAFFHFRGASSTPVRYEDSAYPLRSSAVSGNFFQVLRTDASIGRALRPADDVPGAEPVIVLSDRVWRREFGADSTVIGRSLTMAATGRSYRIVGVMPRGLEYPRGTEAWLPVLAYGAAGGFLDAVSGELDILARLAPGGSKESARAELTAFFQRPETPPEQRTLRGAAYGFAEVVLGDTKPAMMVVTLASALLLFITCINVASLLLVRGLARTREIAVRSALGAERWRIAAQHLAESSMLATAAGVLGTGLAVVAVEAFRSLAPSDLPRVDEVGVSGAMVAVAFAISAGAMLLSGLAPAIAFTRVDVSGMIRVGARATGSARVQRWTHLLVVLQVAIATLCLSAAGLMGRSLRNLVTLDLEFEPSSLLAVDLVAEINRFENTKGEVSQLEQLLPILAAVPGVAGVSPVLSPPFIGVGGGIDGRVRTPDQTESEASENPVLNMEVVTPSYFSTLEVPILDGRSFVDADREDAPRVVVVSRSTARHFWPRGGAIGQRLRVPGGEATVVGVVADTRYREFLTARPSIYFPLAQSVFPVAPETLLVRTSGAAEDAIPAIRRAISDANLGFSVASAATLETLLSEPRGQPRLNTLVIGLFAAAAVALAAIGVFSVLSTMVRLRTLELGIRAALGATAGDLQAIVVRRALAITVVGASVGVACAFAAAPLIQGLLFGVDPDDPLTLAGTVTVMIVVGAFATLIPARAGTRVEPILALRER